MGFSSVSLSYGSLVFPFTGYTTEPVQIQLMSIKEKVKGRNDSLFVGAKSYDPIEGEIIIRATGPTTSGILNQLYEVEQILDAAKKFVQLKSQTPITMNIDNKSVLVLDGFVEYVELQTVKTYKTVKAKVHYTRRALVGDAPSISTNEFFSGPGNSRVSNVFNIFDTSATSLIPAPTDVSLLFVNTDRYLPSGYLFVANEPIVSISGSDFYLAGGVTVNPPQLRLYNENQNNAYGVYTGGGTDGTLGFLPTNTNTVVTSGTVYGNGRITDTVSSVYGADVYGTFKTTFSGTIYGVTLTTTGGFPLETRQTTETLLGNIQTPTVVYLGRIAASQPLTTLALSLSVRSTNIASGILLMDQLVLQPYKQEGTRTIALGLFDGLLLTESTGVPLASGNIELDIFSNYMPGTTYPKNSPYPMIQYYRTTGTSLGGNLRGKSATPQYYGNVYLENLISDYDRAIAVGSSDSQTLSLMFLATGSTYQTVSGLRYWRMSDRNNLVTKMRIQGDAMANPNLNFYDLGA